MFRRLLSIPCALKNAVLREIDQRLALSAAQRHIEIWADTLPHYINGDKK